MFSRINIFGIITDHIRTFSYDKKGNVKPLVFIFFFFFPFIPSIALVWFNHSLAKDTTNTAISVLSIFVGLLLNLLILLFGLGKDTVNPYLTSTIKESIINISFAILVSIFGIIFLLIGLGDIKPQIISDIFSVLSYYCIVQFFLTLILTLKKIYAVFLTEIDKK